MEGNGMEEKGGSKPKVKSAKKNGNKGWFSKKFVALSMFSVGVVVAVPIEGAVENLLVEYFPEYYENDAKQIIESQQSNFDEIKNAVSQLKRELETDEGRKIAERISGQVSEALSNNAKLTKVLASIQEENNRLRFELSNTKGFDGGSDLRIVEDTGLKIDSAIVISSLGAWYNGREFNISTDSGTEKHRLEPGESFFATNELGMKCRFTFLEHSNDISRMAKDCKGGKSDIAKNTTPGI